ncbi:hypothetical protein [Niabella hirudinis]|uniref:hypothetical protein n=1 Tax=Niabella hirudinis TaxID=1285929 RepID=UPI003EC0A37F
MTSWKLFKEQFNKTGFDPFIKLPKSNGAPSARGMAGVVAMTLMGSIVRFKAALKHGFNR